MLNILETSWPFPHDEQEMTVADSLAPVLFTGPLGVRSYSSTEVYLHFQTTT